MKKAAAAFFFLSFLSVSFSQPQGTEVLQTTNSLNEKISVEMSGTLITGSQSIFGVKPSQKTPENFKSIFQTQSEEYSGYGFSTEAQWDSFYRAQNPNAVSRKANQPQGSCPLNKIVF